MHQGKWKIFLKQLICNLPVTFFRFGKCILNQLEFLIAWHMTLNKRKSWNCHSFNFAKDLKWQWLQLCIGIYDTCVTSMIHSARRIVPSVAITIDKFKIFCFERFSKVIDGHQTSRVKIVISRVGLVHQKWIRHG